MNAGEALFGAAMAAAQRGQLLEAARLCMNLLQLDAAHFEGVHLLGLIRHMQGANDEALIWLERAVGFRPDSAKAHNNRGVVLQALGRADVALAAYEAAIALDPGYADAHLNRGVTLKQMGRAEDALIAYRQAIRIEPRLAEAWNNAGVVLQDLHRFDEAREAYVKAIELMPAYADAHWNLGRCSLLLGDYVRGWQEYEWRWRRPAFARLHRQMPQARWQGEALNGRRILLHAEQGLGDTLQFLRYLPLVVARGGRIVLEVQAALKPLLRDWPELELVLGRGETLPEFDVHCPLLSLPGIFGTTLDTIPPVQSSQLATDSSRDEAWRQRLGPRRTRLRVGFVWSGNPEQQDNALRSLPLGDLLSIAGPDVECISLQRDLRGPDDEALVARGKIRHFGEDLTDFAETAALIRQVDLVISVCTSVAHLAGIMQRPLWVLLQYAHDWRWLLERDDSPWYPSARLFRQRTQGNWAEVLEASKAALSGYVVSSER